MSPIGFSDTNLDFFAENSDSCQVFTDLDDEMENNAYFSRIFLRDSCKNGINRPLRQSDFERYASTPYCASTTPGQQPQAYCGMGRKWDRYDAATIGGRIQGLAPSCRFP